MYDLHLVVLSTSLTVLIDNPEGFFAHSRNAQLNVPIYLDDDNKEFIDRIVKKKKSNSNTKFPCRF